MRGEVLKQNGHRLFYINIAVPADVRRHDHFRAAPQRMFARQRLDVEHVEARAAKAACFECCKQRVFIHDLAA